MNNTAANARYFNLVLAASADGLDLTGSPEDNQMDEFIATVRSRLTSVPGLFTRDDIVNVVNELADDDAHCIQPSTSKEEAITALASAWAYTNR